MDVNGGAGKEIKLWRKFCWTDTMEGIGEREVRGLSLQMKV